MNVRLSVGHRLGAGAALGALTAMILSGTAHAGGTIGWADAVTQFSDEGAAVGAAAVVLGIIAVGAVLMFGITGLITTVVMFCLGGALMANSQNIETSLFQSGGGGGSIAATSYALKAGPPAVMPWLPMGMMLGMPMQTAPTQTTPMRSMPLPAARSAGRAR